MISLRDPGCKSRKTMADEQTTEVELSKFISSTLVDIASGVVEANVQFEKAAGDSSPNKYFIIDQTFSSEGSDKSTISFDIAITAALSSKGEGGFKVNVANLVAAGAGLDKTTDSSVAHRIQFNVSLQNEIS